MRSIEYRAAAAGAAGFWRRVLEPRQPQDLPLHRRRARVACAPRRRRRRPAGRPLSPVFRARQGLRGPRRIRRVVALLRARQCVEARREPLPPGNHRAQHREPEDGLHPGILRAAHGLWRREHGADLRARTAAFGIDADRADPRLALRGRRHAGARRRFRASCSNCRAATPISSRRDIPACSRNCRPRRFVRFAEKYLRDTRVYRTGKPRFIDKMPNNFRHIGFIHLMFPNAKIIDARREPMACCFGNLKQLFARGQEFTYSIDDIARYYRTYLELMEHWDAALPGTVLRVHHEDVVEDLERSVRRILDFCELPFEPACLEFHRTERSIRHGELGAGAPAHLPRGPRPVAPLRGLARTRCARRSATRSCAIAARPRASLKMPPGRNEACSCGSGRKFKHCCGRAGAAREAGIECARLLALGQALEDTGPARAGGRELRSRNRPASGVRRGAQRSGSSAAAAGTDGRCDRELSARARAAAAVCRRHGQSRQCQTAPRARLRPPSQDTGA